MISVSVDFQSQEKWVEVCISSWSSMWQTYSLIFSRICIFFVIGGKILAMYLNTFCSEIGKTLCNPIESNHIHELTKDSVTDRITTQLHAPYKISQLHKNRV